MTPFGFAAIGCAAAPPAARHSAATLAPQVARDQPRGDDFSAMSWEDRHDQMTWVVLPTMARSFQKFERSRDATLTCRSCHGPDPESVAYRMPRDLPALDPDHLPTASDVGERGRTARFMIETVTPTMADLLGEPSYDAKTRQGFGCFKCHPAIGATDQRRAP